MTMGIAIESGGGANRAGPQNVGEGMRWVSVEDGLPEDGQAVLVRYAHDNWKSRHTLADGGQYVHWRWQAARFVRGRTREEAEASGVYRGEDQWGNNRVPYRWEGFGGWNLGFGGWNLFGQDVTHWAAITDPVDG